MLNRMLLGLTIFCSVLLCSCSVPSYSDLNPPYTSNEENLAADDTNVSNKIERQLEALFPDAEIKVVSNNFHVLVVGQVTSKKDHDEICLAINEQHGVKKCWNYTTIDPNPHLYLNSGITKKVKNRLSLEKNIDPEKITVLTVGGIVYLLGSNIGNLTYFDKSIRGIYTIKGVIRVYDLVSPGPKDYYSLEQDSY